MSIEMLFLIFFSVTALAGLVQLYEALAVHHESICNIYRAIQ
jgi:hypothetical protein